jgi:prophage regulatory protein
MFNKYRKGIAMSHRVLKINDVKVLTGKSRSSIYDAIKEGTFPRQITLGPRAVGWLESSIDAWIQSRIELSSKVGA